MTIMIYNRLLTPLLFVSCSFVFVGAWIFSSKSSYLSKLNVRSTQLHGTQAVATEDNITPTIYEDDLYRVLEVPFGASKMTIKQAYLKKVYLHHPDRNKTDEALQIFRNVTYAYQVLAKDPSSRREYDSKFKAKQYIKALEQVSSGVLEPLAVGVALPLLNFTIRSIGRVALPIFQDTLEQSVIVLKTALDLESQSSIAGDDDIMQRTSQALERTRVNQRLRRMTESSKNLNLLKQRQLDKLSAEQLQETFWAAECAKYESLEAAIVQDEQISNQQNLLLKYDFITANSTFTELSNFYQQETLTREKLQKQEEILVLQSIAVSNEILELENALKIAKLRLQTVNLEKEQISFQLLGASHRVVELSKSVERVENMKNVTETEFLASRSKFQELQHQKQIASEKKRVALKNLQLTRENVSFLQKKVEKLTEQSEILLKSREKEEVRLRAIDRLQVERERERREDRLLLGDGTSTTGTTNLPLNKNND